MRPRYSAWRRRLQTIDDAGRRRRLRRLEPTGPTTGRLDGQDVIVACSNDYLGLAWDIRDHAIGTGSGSSRLVSGNRPVHEALEAEVEALFGRPALLFPSGYHANLAVFSSVCQPIDLACSDELNHASIIDGLRLSKADRLVVPHARPDRVPTDARLVVVEGLFSMDGDVPPLADYPTAPWLAVDEAHAVGVLGPRGRGACAAAGVVPDILIGTFGKAYGSAGAFVVGPQELKDLLINVGRSFIFTTALPEPVAALALEGMKRASDELRERLTAHVKRFRSGLRSLGWHPLGDHHIVPLVVGSSAMALSDQLLERGVFAAGIRYPTVPAGKERIRFTLSAAHTADQIDQILEALGPNPQLDLFA